MSAPRIVVLGGGFAGLWSAVGAARKLDELGVTSDAVEVVLVNRDAFHSIRVRNYESDLRSVRVPLDDVLEPIGVGRIEGEVAGIDLDQHAVSIRSNNGEKTLAYDRLVFALGSQLRRPSLPGLEKFAFDIDTYNGAAKLKRHLERLPSQPATDGQFTVLIVGAGLTGIELAAEMPVRLREIVKRTDLSGDYRVILADHHPHVGSDMGESARPVIEEALTSLGVETRLGIRVVSVDGGGVTLETGERIAASTVVWCAGMQANPLTRSVSSNLDRFCRIPVDQFLRVQGANHLFAAGDCAWSMMDDCHTSVMSCQHGRPMGRFAGHNVVSDLLGLSMLPLQIDWYVTILDLGPWGAVYTQGWDRQVVMKGLDAKKVKMEINGRRIYPPLNRNRAEILAAAAPVVQRPPTLQQEP